MHSLPAPTNPLQYQLPASPLAAPASPSAAQLLWTILQNERTCCLVFRFGFCFHSRQLLKRKFYLTWPRTFIFRIDNDVYPSVSVISTIFLLCTCSGLWLQGKLHQNLFMHSFCLQRFAPPKTGQSHSTQSNKHPGVIYLVVSLIRFVSLSLETHFSRLRNQRKMVSKRKWKLHLRENM